MPYRSSRPPRHSRPVKYKLLPFRWRSTLYPSLFNSPRCLHPPTPFKNMQTRYINPTIASQHLKVKIPASSQSLELATRAPELSAVGLVSVTIRALSSQSPQLFLQRRCSSFRNGQLCTHIQPMRRRGVCLCGTASRHATVKQARRVNIPERRQSTQTKRNAKKKSLPSI